MKKLFPTLFIKRVAVGAGVVWIFSALPLMAGVNILTNGPSTSGSNNWSMASAPVSSSNPGSFQDLVIQPANTNDLYQAAANIYSQSLNVTNGGAYTIIANNSLFSPTNSTIRLGNTPTNTANPFTNSLSGIAQDLIYLTNNSSFKVLPGNSSTGDQINVPLQQAGNFNISTGCVLTINVPITGSGSKNLTLTGGGTNIFGGANTIAGNITNAAGTLILNGIISNSNAGLLIVQSNATMIENASGSLGGALPLTINGGGTVMLAGTNTYSGLTKVVGLLQVSGAAALSAASTLNSGGSTGDPTIVNFATADNYVMNVCSIGGIMRFTGPAAGSTTITFTNGGAFTGGAATKKISTTNVTLVINGPAGTNFDLLGPNATTNRDHVFQADAPITFNVPLVGGNAANTAGFSKSGGSVMTLSGANTYNGDTRVTAGTLRLAAGATIANTTNIVLAAGATLDVSPVGNFALGSAQALSNSVPGAVIIGNFNASAGAVALVAFTNGTPSLTVTNGALTLAAATRFYLSISNGGVGLDANSYKLVAKGPGGSVAGTASTNLTIAGDGVAAGATAALSISNNELYLVVSSGTLSEPVTSGFTLSSGQAVLTFSGSSGQTWNVISTTNLTTPLANWITNASGTFSGVPVMFTNLNPSGPQQFYRIKSP
jgi:autotransporter-associated beta strand protein